FGDALQGLAPPAPLHGFELARRVAHERQGVGCCNAAQEARPEPRYGQVVGEADASGQYTGR
ncbi:hypothetical protein O988_03377, partial [Pseudogymnoascus sp. VKM F-3808]